MGKILIKSIKTGEDYAQMCINEYNRIRNKQHIDEETLEL